MKMFKKLMALALTAVMAVSMLTGCALTDAAKKNALIKALNSDSVKSTYTYISANYDGVARAVWKNELNEGKTATAPAIGTINHNKKNYIYCVVETPESAKKSVNWVTVAQKVDKSVSPLAVKTGDKMDKIKIDVAFESYKKDGADKTTYYAIIIAETK